MPSKILMHNMTTNHFLISQFKKKKKRTKNVTKSQEMMTIQQGKLLDYFHHQNHYKFIGINLSRQTNTNIPQQIDFTGTEEDDGTKMFLLLESSKKHFLILV